MKPKTLSILCIALVSVLSAIKVELMQDPDNLPEPVTSMLLDQKAAPEDQQMASLGAQQHPDLGFKPKMEFQIKSRMSGGRVLYVAEDNGKTGQKLLKLRKPKNDAKEFFVFDNDLGEVTLASDKRYVVQMEKGSITRGKKLVVAHVTKDCKDSNKIKYFPGNYKNMRLATNIGLCFDIYGGKDVDGQSVVFWNCHNGANQKWFPAYKLDDKQDMGFKDRPFQIKSAMAGGRVLYVAEKNSGYTMRMRAPKNDWREWFVFDKKTHSVRVQANKDLAVSFRKAAKISQNTVVEARPFTGNDNERMNYVEGQFSNFHNFGQNEMCLMPYNGYNREGMHMIYGTCRSGQYQLWYPEYGNGCMKQQNLGWKGGKTFQIWHNWNPTYQHVMYVAESIGHGQYAVKFRKANNDAQEWFEWDQNSGTVRWAKNKRFVLTIELGGITAKKRIVIAPYNGKQAQKLKIDPRTKRINSAQVENMCIQSANHKVSGGTLWLQRCRGTSIQQWYQRFNPGGYGLQSGKQFQIRSTWNGRFLYAAEKWGSVAQAMYRVRIRSHYKADEWREWFTFDKATKSVRLANNPDLVLTYYTADRIARGHNLVLRAWNGKSDMRLRFIPGTYHNFHNGQADNLCIDIWRGQNRNNWPMIFWTCHNGGNQRFAPVYGKGVINRNLGFAKNSKPFQIKSRGGQGRVLYVAGSIGKSQWEVKIRTAKYDGQEFWVYDTATGSVRLARDKRFVLTQEKVAAGTLRRGLRTVIRPWSGRQNERLKVQGQRIHNAQSTELCMDIYGARDADGTRVHVWNCHGGWNQKWYLKYKQSGYGLQSGKQFQIRSSWNGRVLYAAEKWGSVAQAMYRVRIRSHYAADEWREWFTFDKATQSVRLANNPDLVLTYYTAARIARGHNLVLRAWNGKRDMRLRYIPGTYHNFHNGENDNLCMDIWQGRNANNWPMIFWTCHNGHNQKFAPRYGKGVTNRNLGFAKNSKPFQIKSRGNGRRVLYVAGGIGKSQWEVKIRTPKYDGQEYWFYDTATGSVRLARDKRFVLTQEKTTVGTLRKGLRTVVRPWSGRQNERLKLVGQRIHNAQSTELCMDIYGARDTDGTRVHVWNCHGGWNQKWYVNYKQSYGLQSGKQFQIRSTWNGRMLYAAEKWGSVAQAMYRVRIRSHLAADEWREWFIFDKATKSVRLANNPDLVLTYYTAARISRGHNLVLRAWNGKMDMRLRYIPGTYHNFHNGEADNLCIDIWKGQNRNNWPMIFWTCHNGGNQRFAPRYGKGVTKRNLGIKDTAKPFQIKSRGGQGRVLYVAGSIGSSQFEVKIRTAKYDGQEFFTYDSATGSVRLARDKRFVLTQEKVKAGTLRRGLRTVVRPWSGRQNERLKVQGQRIHNAQSTELCMDIYGARDTDGTRVHVWNCHGGWNQKWYLKYKDVSYGMQTGKQFQIRSAWNGRVLYAAEKWGSVAQAMYRVRIRSHYAADEWREWFIFDKATKSVRLANNPDLVLTYYTAARVARGHNLVLRAWNGKRDMRLRYIPGTYHNFHNGENDNLCIDIWQGKNANNWPMIFWTCHNGHNQKWQVRYGKGVTNRNLGFAKNSKPFQIKSRGGAGRALYVAGSIGSSQWEVKIRTAKSDGQEFWVYDTATGSVRLARDRRFVLTQEKVKAGTLRRGLRTVIRPWSGRQNERLKIQGQRIHNAQSTELCMDIYGARDTDGTRVHVWNCHGGWNQKWYLHYKADYGLKTGQQFQIRSTWNGRVLYAAERWGAAMQRVRIRSHTTSEEWREWFIFDKGTQSVRLANNPDLVLTYYTAARIARGHNLVLRAWNGKRDMRLRYIPGTYHNFHNGENDNLCMDIWQGKNANNWPMIFWTCHNGHNQRFAPVYGKGVTKRNLGFATSTKSFQIKSRGGQKRVLYVAGGIGSSQWEVKIRTPKNDGQEFFVYDAATGSVRLARDRRFVLTQEKTKAGTLKRGLRVVVRPWTNKQNERLKLSGVRIHNAQVTSQCIDIYGARDADGTRVHLWNCHGGWNQKWLVFYKRIPFEGQFRDIGAGLKGGYKFQIKSRVANWVLTYNNPVSKYAGNQILLRLKVPSGSSDEYFFFESRTQTIRSFDKPTMVLAPYTANNVYVMLAPYTAFTKGSKDQRFTYEGGQYHNLHLLNNPRRCLHAYGLRDRYHMVLANCNNGANQRWSIKYYSAGANNGFTPNKLFTVTSKMSGGRALYVSDDGSLLQQDERYVKIRSAKGTDDEKFYYDPKDKLVHPFLFKHMHLSKQSQGDVYILTVRDNTAHFGHPTIDSWFSEFDQIIGGSSCNQGGCGGLAVGALDDVNDNDVYVALEPNDMKPATKWNIKYQSATSTSKPTMKPRAVSNEHGGYGFNTGKSFTIRSRSNGRRVLFVENNVVKLRTAKGTKEEVFKFANGAITTSSGRYLSAQLSSKGDSFKLVTSSKKGDVNEYFTRSGKNIALMTNKQAVLDIPQNKDGAAAVLIQNKSGDRNGFDIVYK